MTDLATRLEQGPGSRELSDEVLLALGWRRKYPSVPWWHHPSRDPAKMTRDPLSPTESVDDGLALLREMGWYLDDLSDTSYDGERAAFALIRPRKALYPTNDQVEGWSTTLPLALCAALVRAAGAQKEASGAE